MLNLPQRFSFPHNGTKMTLWLATEPYEGALQTGPSVHESVSVRTPIMTTTAAAEFVQLARRLFLY